MSKATKGKARAQKAATSPESKQEQVAPAPKLSMAQTLAKYRAKGRYGVFATDNRSGIDNGDPIAAKLRGLSPDEVVALASRVLDEDLGAKYGHLNAGQRRMNASNKLRGAVKRGDVKVTDIK